MAFSNLRHLASLAEHSDVYQYAERVAIIDMGSNSFRLIVIEYVPTLSFRLIDEVREAVRLSEGMEESGVMRAEAMDRAARAMRMYAGFCRASNIKHIVVAGTSAIRDAENQDRFLRRIEAETDLNIRVLSEDEEAYYAYLAAVNSTTLENGFVLDLGGGSVEICRVENRRLVNAVSLPLGAVRLTERFLKNDPATPAEIGALQRHLREEFAKLDWFKADEGMTLVGEGGTLRLIGRLAQKQAGYPLDDLHGYVVKLPQVMGVVNDLAPRKVIERKAVPGMKADRADLSLAGAELIREVMQSTGFNEMTICSQGMREGLFYEYFLSSEEDDQPPIFDNVRKASVLNLAHVYRFQEKHAQHVAQLTLSMFDQLPEDSHLRGESERELLWAASILHDIGTAIDYHDHHLHSSYLILNAGLPGYSHREIAMIALLARYHRKGKPTPDELVDVLRHDDNLRLTQLAALLRLAEQMERSRDGVVEDVVLTFGDDWAQMELLTHGGSELALWLLDSHRTVFEKAFNRKLSFTVVPAKEDETE